MSSRWPKRPIYHSKLELFIVFVVLHTLCWSASSMARKGLPVLQLALVDPLGVNIHRGGQIGGHSTIVRSTDTTPDRGYMFSFTATV